MPRRKWTANGLADETGLDRRTVTDRLALVKPCESRKSRKGETRYYWGRDAFPALYAEQTSVPAAPDRPDADAGERLKELKVEEFELDLAERRGELVHAASVQAAFDAVLLESNARFGGIAQSIADEVRSATDRDTVVRVIEAAINGARELFANIRVPVVGAERHGAERGARAAAAANGDGGGMGGSEPRSIS